MALLTPGKRRHMYSDYTCITNFVLPGQMLRTELCMSVDVRYARCTCESMHAVHLLTPTVQQQGHSASILCQSGSKEEVWVMRNCLPAHNRGSLKITPTRTQKIHIICDLVALTAEFQA